MSSSEVNETIKYIAEAEYLQFYDKQENQTKINASLDPRSGRIYINGKDLNSSAPFHEIFHDMVYNLQLKKDLKPLHSAILNMVKRSEEEYNGESSRQIAQDILSDGDNGGADRLSVQMGMSDKGNTSLRTGNEGRTGESVRRSSGNEGQTEPSLGSGESSVYSGDSRSRLRTSERGRIRLDGAGTDVRRSGKTSNQAVRRGYDRRASRRWKNSKNIVEQADKNNIEEIYGKLQRKMALDIKNPDLYMTDKQYCLMASLSAALKIDKN